MSKHWPPDNVVRFDFRRMRHRSRSNPWVPAALLAGAALVGAGVGIGETLLSNPAPVEVGAPIEWNAVQALPTAEMTAADEAWEQRGVPAGEQSREERRADGGGGAPIASPSASVTRASFGFCHSGGGTNCVVDGDTLWLGGQRIRVADIDAPETHPPSCAQEAQLGNRATQRLRQLLNGGAISLQPIDRDEDKYGRKLRVVLVDGRSVGDTLVGEGLARYYEGGRRPWC